MLSLMSATDAVPQPPKAAGNEPDVSRPAREAPTRPRRLILVGNANVGKSALFGALTDRFATISNYPGTTVAVVRNEATLAGRTWEVIDTPGTTGLMPQSEDEAVTERILLDNPDATVLCVIDARQLRRGLALLWSLADIGQPIVVVLNMMAYLACATPSPTPAPSSRALCGRPIWSWEFARCYRSSVMSAPGVPWPPWP